ncbi:DeoR/GlpR family DNA-binding transcription regulator [Desulfovibrio inopinatus]|uniref:DeoR/GlpR family DNA-binding transcription regulator n=1 Tax=Desulfovibrio inopinatus TaxID=102109 RepID=UPI000424BD24|nr:DeoR family transcriptional regulator [Desulfovibrio inopinatus]
MSDSPTLSPAGHVRDDSAKHAAVRQRHEQMVHLVQEMGFATIGALAEHFDVTPQTVRRDINTLSDLGLLQRYHGGAGPSVSTENVDYSSRQVICRAEKRRIGELCAEHIPNRSSLFINIGTTTEEVAKALARHSKLRVITNNLNVAGILSDNENIEIIVAGGVIRHRDRGIVGESAVDFIKQFKVDYGIIGISGVDMDGTMLDFDYREVRAAKAIMENSRKTFLVTDHTKFGRNAMVRLGSIREVHAVFTDKIPPQSVLDEMDRGDTKLFVANMVS